LAKTPRKWTGARTPSGLKRVRSSERRHAILQPRRTAAKTLVKNALVVATSPDGQDAAAALAAAMSALDRAAKTGAIHPNAAARRKSRLAIKVNAALVGQTVAAGGRTIKTTGTAAAAKAAKARIAAGKAAKAKGAQTAAGKARAALSKTARAEAAAQAAAAPASEPATTSRARATAAKPAAAKAPAKTAAKATTKTTATKTTATKAAAPKATGTKASKAAAEKTAAEKPARASRAKKEPTS
jgi:ribosomal protein S20